MDMKKNCASTHQSDSFLRRSSMQLANRVDIQLRSAVEWQDLFHPDAVVLRQRYSSYLFSFCLYRKLDIFNHLTPRSDQDIPYNIK